MSGETHVPRIGRPAARDALPPGAPVRRTRRDWAVDAALTVLAVLGGAVSWSEDHPGGLFDDPGRVIDLGLGAVAIGMLWVRRRWLLPAATVAIVASAFAAATAGASAILLFLVAVHRSWRQLAPLAVLSVATGAVYAAIHPDEEIGYGWTLVILVVAFAAIVGWGVYVRSRRQLLLSLRDRAQRAVAEQQLLVAQARDHERARIAREMHDVLAHRISLLSMHAGALEFRPDASPEEVAEAAGVIRSNAHLALEDLREVIGVLRGDDATTGEPTSTTRPQPTMDDVPALLAESRAAGVRVRERVDLADGPAIPAALGRTAYRVVQEGLTNARKHAPGATVDVRIAGAPEDGVTVEVLTPAAAGRLASSGGPAVAAIPGSGTGIVGLAERAALAGGRLDHGTTPDGGFRLRAWLPWST
jgi:signal transduction histidine kinase